MSCIPINDFSLITLCDATKAGKLYSIVPDSGAGDFDVVRATTATYLGSDGLIKTAANDEPRIEFNPDGSYKGLLVEPAATNLVLRSEEFDDAVWTTNAQEVTISENTITAPDGTLSADAILATTSDSLHFVQQRDISVTSGTNYTVSCFLKKNGYRYAELRLSVNIAAEVVVDFDLGTATGGTLIELANGWYRVIATATATSTGGNTRMSIILRDDSNNSSFVGDVTKGVFAWGAQLEESTVPTSYIPTVASTVTRAADVISKTGASALISQGSGTILFRALFDSPTQINIMGIIATVTNEQMKLTYSASKIELFANDTSVGVLNGTFDFTSLDKIDLGNYDGDAQLDAHIQNFATI